MEVSGQQIVPPERTWNLLGKTLWLVPPIIFLWITISFCEKLFAQMSELVLSSVLKNDTAEHHEGGISCLPWIGNDLAQPVDACVEWFLTCTGTFSPWKTILGLIWGGKNQRSLIMNIFAEVMLFTPSLKRIGLSLRYLENKMAEFAGKEA